MPIFCSNVNRASDGKLVPITCHNDASIGPDNLVIALKLVERSPENGTLWELSMLWFSTHELFFLFLKRVKDDFN